MLTKGLIHVYYGDGKGKTSSALGLAIRAAGCGLKVCFTQFLKPQGSGEIRSLKKIDGIEIADMPVTLPFYFQMNEREKAAYREYAHKTFLWAIARKVDVLIFDELLDLISLKIIDENELLHFIASKPSTLELVITGHESNQNIINAADYVTFFQAEKHPYNKGVQGRKGIEF